MIGVTLGAVLALAGAGQPVADTAQPEAAAVVWAVGDGADGSAPARRLARRIERDDPDAFLYLGDVYPSGRAQDFALNYDSVYGRLAPITWPTAGNHDWGNRHTGYYPYWRRQGRAKPWYRFELAGWELLGLNSEAPHDPASKQVRWLGRVLSQSATTCRLAFWHRPRYSAGAVHGDAPDVAPLWDGLRGRARLVLNGHEHVLMRYRKRGGLTEFVAGAGGHLRYSLRPDARLAFARSDRTGALRISLRPGAAELEFRDLDGKVLDRSRARCRPPPTQPRPAESYRSRRGRRDR